MRAVSTFRIPRANRLNWLVLGIVVSTCGCSLTSSKYRADNLPAHLQVASASNVQTLDLSRLASATPSNDRINVGDVLEVTISSGISAGETFTFPVRVLDDGSAKIPIVGQIDDLAGKELSDAEAVIAFAAVQKGLYKSPHVTATMKRRKMHRVTVMGAVEKQGVYELPADGCDLLAAISAAGGPSKNATSVVEVSNINGGFQKELQRDPVADGPGNPSGLSPAGHRTNAHATGVGPRHIQIDLVSAVKEGAGTNGKYNLPDGSVVNVKKQDSPPIQVQGLVNKPGSYDLPVGKDVRLLDAIGMANWISSPVADKVYVIRREAGKPDPAVIQVSITKAKESGTENLLIGPGDVVLVEQTPATIVLYAFRLINFGATLPLTALF